MAVTGEQRRTVVSIEDARKRGAQFDRDIVGNTMPADIERQKREDNHPTPEHRGAVRLVIKTETVSALRAKFGLSQQQFAKRFGLSLRTVQEWEQKRRAPDGPAKLLLRIIAEDPEAVERVVTCSDSK